MSKDVSHVVEQNRAQVLAQIRQGKRRQTQLQLIEEQRITADGKPGFEIARASLIESKSAMRVRAAAKKTLGQGHDSLAAPAKGLLKTNFSEAGEDQPLFVEQMIGGVGGKQFVKARLRTKGFCRYTKVEGRVVALAGVKRIITFVTNQGKTGHTHAYGLR